MSPEERHTLENKGLNMLNRVLCKLVSLFALLIVFGGVIIACGDEPVCSRGQTVCGSECHDLSSDIDNCGACGQACSESNACFSGECRLHCPFGLSVCNGTCRDPQTDERNCGTCGHVCAEGEVCVLGGCRFSCPPGFSGCWPQNRTPFCVDSRHDPDNCGACGRSCASGELCQNGACETTCGSGFTVCSSMNDAGVLRYCADLHIDRNNCGACGHVCPEGQICRTSVCMLSCPLGRVQCRGNCVDPQTDPSNCGACGHACPMGHVCSRGACALVCSVGLVSCAGSCRDVLTDRAYCGSCVGSCAEGYICRTGRCVLSCQSGLTNCGGVCRDLTSDNRNCGACGNACGAGAVCTSGRCGLSCPVGFVACEGVCRDVRVDANNCGACGRICVSDTGCATRFCSAGTCRSNPRPDGDGCSNDGNECTTDVCISGVCQHNPVASFTPCSAGICSSATCQPGSASLVASRTAITSFILMSPFARSLCEQRMQSPPSFTPEEAIATYTGVDLQRCLGLAPSVTGSVLHVVYDHFSWAESSGTGAFTITVGGASLTASIPAQTSGRGAVMDVPVPPGSTIADVVLQMRSGDWGSEIVVREVRFN